MLRTFFSIAVTMIFVLDVFNFKFVEAQELNLNPRDVINSAGLIKGINTGQVLNRFQFDLPLSLEKINIGTSAPINPTTNIPDINLRQFLTPKNISSDDLGGAIKAVVTLIIEIFLVVISITSQILKFILKFLR